jgi:hypothetical protein
MTALRGTAQESALRTFDMQIAPLSNGAPDAGPRREAWSESEIVARLLELQADRKTLPLQWDERAATRLTGAAVGTQPQPCPQALGIAH